MSATQDQINGYLYNVRSAYSTYGSNLAKAQRLGRTDLDCYKLKFRALKYLLRIVSDYFNTPNYAVSNFFTTSEIRDVMQQINNICGTNYIIEL
jgi:hypothetical protein